MYLPALPPPLCVNRLFSAHTTCRGSTHRSIPRRLIHILARHGPRIPAFVLCCSVKPSTVCERFYNLFCFVFSPPVTVMGVAEDFAPSFTQKPQLRQEDEGNRLVFECKILSSPKPDITWFRSETQLAENNRTVMKIQTVGTNLFLVVLELDDVVESDAGLYKVKAKNKMGEVAASINLNFSRKYFFIVSDIA
ncbi:hypothetical protein J6590_055694 [Homalodisca vitripennis]|nr:hypothetical protein J6590_055694 [Homalodisca vitripennis]